MSLIRCFGEQLLELYPIIQFFEVFDFDVE